LVIPVGILKGFDMENIAQNQIQFTPEKSKQIALARLDLVHQW